MPWHSQSGLRFRLRGRPAQSFLIMLVPSEGGEEQSARTSVTTRRGRFDFIAPKDKSSVPGTSILRSSATVEDGRDATIANGARSAGSLERMVRPLVSTLSW